MTAGCTAVGTSTTTTKGSLVAEASSVIQRVQKVPIEMMSGCPRRQSLALTYNPGVIVLSRRFEAVWS